jgi:hypothetical protein
MRNTPSLGPSAVKAAAPLLRSQEQKIITKNIKKSFVKKRNPSSGCAKYFPFDLRRRAVLNYKVNFAVNQKVFFVLTKSIF